MTRFYSSTLKRLKHLGVFDYVNPPNQCRIFRRANVITSRPNQSPGSATLLSVATVVAILYFARDVFIPLTLAVLFAFLLAPLVMRLRHWGLGRVPSVLIIVHLAFAAMAALG